MTAKTIPDSIIAATQLYRINDQPTELLLLHSGLVIALSETALACYRDIDSVGDPLGNGLISWADMVPGAKIQFENDHCIDRYKAGFVGLIDGQALLIAPYKVRLYPNNQDALRGLNCLAELALPDIDVL